MPNPNTRSEREAGSEKSQDKNGQAALKGGKSDGDKRKWDIIDERAWESFPASDPPASWAGRDIPPQEREMQPDDEPPTKKQTASKNKKKKQAD